MLRSQLVDRALEKGWKAVESVPEDKKRSYYQCFQKDKEYIWIGLRFIEHSKFDIAQDFILEPEAAIAYL